MYCPVGRVEELLEVALEVVHLGSKPSGDLSHGLKIESSAKEMTLCICMFGCKDLLPADTSNESSSTGGLAMDVHIFIGYAM